VKHTHTHTTLSFNLKKQGNSDTYYNMDEPWRQYYAKWNKTQMDRYYMISNVYRQK
jgi:hypothetical protein